MYKTAAILILISAVIQWLGIGEKIYHALWQWYNLKDFSGDGHTTISYTMAIVTYLLSALLVAMGIYISKHQENAFVKLTCKISTVSLIIGILSLSVLLLSPLGELVSR